MPTERIGERYEFNLRYLDVLEANSYQRFLRKSEKHRRISPTYGPQTAEVVERRREFELKRTSKTEREAGRLLVQQ